MGMPQIGASGLPGNRVDAIRAGIIPMVVIVSHLTTFLFGIIKPVLLKRREILSVQGFLQREFVT